MSYEVTLVKRHISNRHSPEHREKLKLIFDIRRKLKKKGDQ